MYVTTVESAICHLALKQQELISACLDCELVGEAKKWKSLDASLHYLIKSTRASFDFVEHVMDGQTLLVGEGNLSFACSLVKKKRIKPEYITATTYEVTDELSEATLKNAVILRNLGAKVYHGVNATMLERHFSSQRFKHVIFQFPHSGSRTPVNAESPNYVLIQNFLISARRLLTSDGAVLISSVDSPHYHGTFQPNRAAKKAGFQIPEIYRFDPNAFPYYTHQMTHQSDSALENHNAFITWVFKPL